jgi:hypothetical protein
MKTIETFGIALVVIGLLIAGGAWWASNAVIIDEKTADLLSGTYWDQNLALKRALLYQSRAARNGLILIMVGSVLQVVGVVLPGATTWK